MRLERLPTFRCDINCAPRGRALKPSKVASPRQEVRSEGGRQDGVHARSNRGTGTRCHGDRCDPVNIQSQVTEPFDTARRDNEGLSVSLREVAMAEHRLGNLCKAVSGGLFLNNAQLLSSGELLFTINGQRGGSDALVPTADKPALAASAKLGLSQSLQRRRAKISSKPAKFRPRSIAWPAIDLLCLSRSPISNTSQVHAHHASDRGSSDECTCQTREEAQERRAANVVVLIMV